MRQARGSAFPFYANMNSKEGARKEALKSLAPTADLKHHNLKRKAKREWKIWFLSLCAHVVCCGQEELKRKCFNFAAIRGRYPHIHTSDLLKTLIFWDLKSEF